MEQVVNISLVVTTYNEEDSVGDLLKSLFGQTMKASEIVVVDGGSTDSTLSIISSFAKIKVVSKKCTRARGRNLGVEEARNSIIVMTDAGCVARPDWLEKITNPFVDPEVDMVAGFYDMKSKNGLQKAMSVFLGVVPEKFGKDFLPSTRSIAFRKSLWKRVGGFPDTGENSAEDTDFNYEVVRAGATIARVKTARVEWGMPRSLRVFFNKINSYAYWDGKNGPWCHPVQKFRSHNIKALLVVGRYMVGGILLFLGLDSPLFWWILFFGLVSYLIWTYRKGGFYVMFLQFLVDVAVIMGFVRGIIRRWVI